MKLSGLICFIAFLIFFTGLISDDAYQEFKVKRKDVFEFTKKPELKVEKNLATISFEVKDFCDVTIAIENKAGKILRHLASGVLGDNAPTPFQKNSKMQTINWDIKDDREVYIEDLQDIYIRVSLGLKPQFERTLNWSPHKRISDAAPLMASAPEGMYVFEGQGVDHLRLFSHEGEYVRTIFPFPSNKIDDVLGLKKYTFIQDGKTLPHKVGFEQTALLSSGSSCWGVEGGHAGGYAATAMAVHNSTNINAVGGKRKIALVYHYLNRLSSEGDSGGLPLLGPKVCFTAKKDGNSIAIGPNSAAFSPDGKYLYLTGYGWKSDSFHVVMRVEYDKQDEPSVFAGQPKRDDGWGSGNDQFCVPTSVACDSEGRVYVADFGNSRVQVFSSMGIYIKSISVPYPANIQIDPISNEMTVASYRVFGCSSNIYKEKKIPLHSFEPSVYKLGTFDKPIEPKAQKLPNTSIEYDGGWISSNGQSVQVSIDYFHKDKPLWVVGRRATLSAAEISHMGQGDKLGGWNTRGIKRYTFQGEKWNTLGDFAALAMDKVKRVDPAPFSRQRLIVNPVDEKLYVIEEQTGPDKSFSSILQVEPNTGNISIFKLPHDCEDMLFDIEGLAYLKTDREITRYDPRTWREVLWDYGVERNSIRFGSSGSYPAINSMSALPIPGSRPGWFHSGGFGISPKGILAVICEIGIKKPTPKGEKDIYAGKGTLNTFKPKIYEGRQGTSVIMVFNKHGILIREDAAPGMTNADGISVDSEGSIYAMVAAPRVLGGKPYFNEKTETIIKFKSKDVKFISSSGGLIPLPKEMIPNRSPDLFKSNVGEFWVNGVEWFYGGVGYGGQGASCTCWHSRFSLDYYARTFAPETDHYSIAVLDSNGNLILRMGKYGNVDDGKPLEAAGGPLNTKSIGGDEISLYHAAYVGVHSDRRLFIHDAGNARILSVKLGYHQSETLKLSDNPNFSSLIRVK